MISRWNALLEIGELEGITQSEIARRLGVSQSSVSRTISGIPALASEYITKICDVLSVDENFLKEASDYPFLPNAFLKFRIRGLRARRRPMAWIEVLCKYSAELKVLLLLQQANQRVAAACVKDDRGSIFLVFVDIPLSWRDVFDYATEQARERIKVKATHFFDVTTLGFCRTSKDIEHFDKDQTDSLIEENFLDVLSEDEKELIRAVRGGNVPIKEHIELAHKIGRT